MQCFNRAKLLAIVSFISAFHAQVSYAAACGPAPKTYGTTQIVLYYPSPKCHGANITRTVAGPPLSKKEYKDGKCYTAKKFNSFILHKTNQLLANDCEIKWFLDESCVNEYGIDQAVAGECHDSRAIFDTPKAPSQSFLFNCYGN